MNLFEFPLSHKVLFVGEGNFSFSGCLLKMLGGKLNNAHFNNVIATCYQKEASPSALVNIEFLRSIGAEVLLGIDATNLEGSDIISSLKFNKIIFNFPHVGGKMKIHLNRELLKNFFISASGMLQPGGQVIVTLCSGQGGTGFDSKLRRWDDTWQIVEQASHGSFVLFDAQNFPNSLFEEYQPVGYRGREQMFSTISAVVHGFCIVNPPISCLNDKLLESIKNFHPLYEDSDLLVSLAHKIAFDRNPLKSMRSPQKYILEILKNNLKVYTDNGIYIEEESSFTIPLDNNHAFCVFRGVSASLRSSLFEVSLDVENDFFISGLVFQKLSADFTGAPVSCHCAIKCDQYLNVIQDYISNLSLLFNFDGSTHYEEEGQFLNVIFENHSRPKNKVISVDLIKATVLFDLDKICSYMFDISPRELWAENISFDNSKTKIIFPSLYPLEFKFDICFSSCKDLDYEQFYYYLHQIPDNLIQSVELLSVYQPTSSSPKSYCFRFVYKSCNKPLHRRLVIEIHQNVIGKMLEKILDVCIH